MVADSRHGCQVQRVMLRGHSCLSGAPCNGRTGCCASQQTTALSCDCRITVHFELEHEGELDDRAVSVLPEDVSRVFFFSKDTLSEVIREFFKFQTARISIVCVHMEPQDIIGIFVDSLALLV